MKAVTEAQGHLRSLLQLVEVGRTARGYRSFPTDFREPGVAQVGRVEAREMVTSLDPDEWLTENFGWS